jgi:ABC-type iron transport system FetAB permease component
MSYTFLLHCILENAHDSTTLAVATAITTISITTFIKLHSSSEIKSFADFLGGKFYATTTLLIICKFSCTNSSLCFMMVCNVATMLITCSIINDSTE